MRSAESDRGRMGSPRPPMKPGRSSRIRGRSVQPPMQCSRSHGVSLREGGPPGNGPGGAAVLVGLRTRRWPQPLSLGCPYNSETGKLAVSNDAPIVRARLAKASLLAGTDDELLEDKLHFGVNPEFGSSSSM